MSEIDQTTEEERESTAQSAGQRGSDDRRSPVNPADNPAPISPALDEEAVRKGEDVLERVKPY
jgi:hypothetical protein